MVAVFTGSGLGIERGSSYVLGSYGQLGSASFGRFGENVSVNAATGNLVISRTDEILIGKGPDDILTRTYNSFRNSSQYLNPYNHMGTYNADGIQGDDWQLNASRRIVISGTKGTSGSTVTLYDWDGSDVTYAWDSAFVTGNSSGTVGAYVSKEGAGSFDFLTYSGTTWTGTDGNTRVKDTFDESNGGRITKTKDLDGNQLLYAYDTGGRLSTVTTDLGEVTSFTWDATSHNLTSIVTTKSDATTLTRVTYGYGTDGLNRLQTVTTDLSPDDSNTSDHNSIVTTYAYDGTSDRIASITQESGGSSTDISKLEFTYDSYTTPRIASVTQTTASGVTHAITFAYTSSTVTTITDSVSSQTTVLTFDSSKQLTRVDFKDGSTTLQTLQYTYNSDGDLLTYTDGGNKTTTFVYDPTKNASGQSHGNATTVCDGAGDTVGYTYGYQNQILTQTNYFTADADHDPNSSTTTPGGPATTYYAYNSEVHLRFSVSPEGVVTEHNYVGWGGEINRETYGNNSTDGSDIFNVGTLSTTDATTWAATIDTWASGRDQTIIMRTNTTYDTRGNVATSTDYAETDSSGAGTSPFSRLLYSFDQFGNLLSRHTETQNSDTYTYDGLGRVITTIDMNGTTYVTAYDDANNKVTITSTGLFTDVTTYNMAGQVTSHYRFDPAASSVHLEETDYTYDSLGRLRMVKDGAGKYTHYLYDKLDRKVAEISDDGSMTEYAYDGSNNVVRTIRYANKSSATFVSGGVPTNVALGDAGVRPTFSTNSADPDSWEWRVYDGASRLTSVTQGDGSTVRYAYDGESNLVSTTAFANVVSSTTVTGWKAVTSNVPTGGIPTSDPTVTADTARDEATKSFYNNDGRLVGTLDGSGYLTQIKYDEAGNRTETIAFWNKPTTTSGSFATVLGTVTTDSTHDIHQHNIYDGRGYLRYEIDPYLRPTEYVYNQAGDVVTRIEYATVLTSPTYSEDYIESHITTSSDDRKSWSVYDTADRLAYAIDANGDVTSYAYDSFGRVNKQTQYSVTRSTTTLPSLTEMSSWVSTYASSANDRVTRTYYDGLGRVIYAVDGENYVTKYDYDGLRRVTHEYRYDAAYATIADGDSVSAIDTTVASGTYAKTSYTFDGAGRLASKVDADGATEAATTSYQYDGIGRLTQRTDPRGYVKTFGYDTAGNVSSEGDPVASGSTATTSYLYDAFGNVTQTTAPVGADGTTTPISYTFYDKLNRVVEQIDPYNIATVTTYAAFGDIATVTHFYTALTGTITPGGTIPTPTANSTYDETTTFTYDRLGHLLTAQDAMGGTESYAYNTFGERSQFTNKLGGVTTFAYDKRGLLTSELFTGMIASRTDGSTEATGVTNKYEYDSRGNRTKMTEAYGLADSRVTEYKYDRLNRLTTTKHEKSDGTGVSVLNSDLTSGGTVIPVETIAYDSRDNIIQTVRKTDTALDSTGTQTFFYYDDLNRKIWEVGPTGTLSGWKYFNDYTEVRVYGDAVTLPGSAGGACPSPIDVNNCRLTTYTYNRAGWLTTTAVASLLTGEYSGSAYGTTTGSVTVTNTYDLRGNVIKQTDGRGNDVFFYYDKLNRKIAQVDQERYLTTYTTDFDGNVTMEKRWANSVPTGTTITTSSAPTTSADSTNDRVTNFTYDLNGRRLTEERTNVKYYNVNASTGALGTEQTGTSLVRYDYNALGEVTRKVEATHTYAYDGSGNPIYRDASTYTGSYDDWTAYTYDVYGRQTQARSAAYYDYRSTPVAVQQITDQYYDGLNNLVRTFEGDQDSAVTVDRVTTFSYDAAGRLGSMTDAASSTHTYSYDKYGQLVLDAYSRLKSDGTSVTEGRATNYDLLGHVILQAAATQSGSVWTMSDKSQTQYNVYGEVSARGANGLWQETFEYDAGGHMWRSTAGDGSARLYLYDKNGTQTLMIGSSGAALSSGSLATMSLADAITALTNNHASGVDIGEYAVTGMTVTITVNDKRGQATSTREALRQLDTSTTQDVVASRVYNAFGEVKQETDARGYVTDYTYSTLGRVTQRQSPTVSWTAENGAVANARPTENYFYDLSGRVVGVQDANGKVNTRSLLAGTGHGGKDDEPLVLTEFHADTGQYFRKYDVFGDLRTETNELGFTTTLSYDKMSRLTEIDHPQRDDDGDLQYDDTQLKEAFAYDGLGQRIKHWNNQYYSGAWMTGGAATYLDFTDYDAQGRVISTKLMAAANGTGGDVTTFTYAWHGDYKTDLKYEPSTGDWAFGGWLKTTTNAAGMSMTEQLDYFGRLIDKVDYGSHDYNYSFDYAGQLKESSITGVSGSTEAYSYFNTGLLLSIAIGSGTTGYTATYKYDAGGHRTAEYYAKGDGTVYEDATMTWDALGRMLHFADAGPIKGADGVSLVYAASASADWEYDLNSNIRHVGATYHELNDDGQETSTQYTTDSWYLYDSMNRFTKTGGTFTGTRGSGSITLGTGLGYDKAGQRVTKGEGGNTHNGDWLDDDHSYSVTYKKTEYYSYTADGYLKQADMGITFVNSGPKPDDTGYTMATYTRDALGRVTNYAENDYDYTQDFTFDVNGLLEDVTANTYTRSATYNERSQVTSDSTHTTRDGGTNYNTSTTYYYKADTDADGVWGESGDQYMGGVVTHQDTTGTDSSWTTNAYTWWDEAKNDVTSYKLNSGSVWTSTYTYTEIGYLKKVAIADGRPRDVTFITDVASQVMQRHSEETTHNDGDPTELHYYFNGMAVGDVGNNGTSNVDYVAAINRHRATAATGNDAGPFAYGTTGAGLQTGVDDGTTNVNFGLNYDPINGLTYENTASHYTVNDGDTLQSIAYALWGDTSFWYMIADANGLLGNETLTAGQDLVIPNKVHNSHNSSDIYRVYDPNEAIGNTSPTTPKPKKPPHDSGCGMAGSFILMVVAMVVAAYVAPMIAAAFTPAAGTAAGLGSAVGSAAGSVATGATVSAGASFASIAGAVVAGAATSIITQGVGLALGIQKRFDWGAVAMAGIGQGIGAALGGGFLNQVFGNLATQGIGMATGLQKKFDWTSLAMAAVNGLAQSEQEAAMGRDAFGDGLLKDGRGVDASSVGLEGSLVKSEGGVAAALTSLGGSPRDILGLEVRAEKVSVSSEAHLPKISAFGGALNGNDKNEITRYLQTGEAIHEVPTNDPSAKTFWQNAIGVAGSGGMSSNLPDWHFEGTQPTQFMSAPDDTLSIDTDGNVLIGTRDFGGSGASIDVKVRSGEVLKITAGAVDFVSADEGGVGIVFPWGPADYKVYIGDEVIVHGTFRVGGGLADTPTYVRIPDIPGGSAIVHFVFRPIPGLTQDDPVVKLWRPAN